MKRKSEEQAIDVDWWCKKSRSLISRGEIVLSVGANRVVGSALLVGLSAGARRRPRTAFRP